MAEASNPFTYRKNMDSGRRDRTRNKGKSASISWAGHRVTGVGELDKILQKTAENSLELGHTVQRRMVDRFSCRSKTDSRPISC